MTLEEFNRQMFRLESTFSKPGEPTLLTSNQMEEFHQLYINYDFKRFQNCINNVIADSGLQFIPRPGELMRYMPPPTPIKPDRQLAEPDKSPAQRIRDKFWGEFSVWMISTGQYKIPIDNWGHLWVTFLKLKKDNKAPKYKALQKTNIFIKALVPFAHKNETVTNRDIEILEGVKNNWVNS